MDCEKKALLEGAIEKILEGKEAVEATPDAQAALKALQARCDECQDLLGKALDPIGGETPSEGPTIISELTRIADALEKKE